MVKEYKWSRLIQSSTGEKMELFTHNVTSYRMQNCSSIDSKNIGLLVDGPQKGMIFYMKEIRHVSYILKTTLASRTFQIAKVIKE